MFSVCPWHLNSCVFMYRAVALNRKTEFMINTQAIRQQINGIHQGHDQLQCKAKRNCLCQSTNQKESEAMIQQILTHLHCLPTSI